MYARLSLGHSHVRGQLFSSLLVTSDNHFMRRAFHEEGMTYTSSVMATAQTSMLHGVRSSLASISTRTHSSLDYGIIEDHLKDNYQGSVDKWVKALIKRINVSSTLSSGSASLMVYEFNSPVDTKLGSGLPARAKFQQ